MCASNRWAGDEETPGAVVRAVGDALTASGLIEDDRFIVKLAAEKAWAVGEKPGAIIRVTEVTA